MKPTVYVICAGFNYRILEITRQLGGRMIIGADGVRGATVEIPEGGGSFMPNSQEALYSLLEKTVMGTVQIDLDVSNLTHQASKTFLQGILDYKRIRR